MTCSTSASWRMSYPGTLEAHFITLFGLFQLTVEYNGLGFSD